MGEESAYNAGDPGSIPGSGRSSGEGNGDPLQYFCLDNPMDRRTWQATIHEVTKSQTRLSNQHFLFFTCSQDLPRSPAPKPRPTSSNTAHPPAHATTSLFPYTCYRPACHASHTGISQRPGTSSVLFTSTAWHLVKCVAHRRCPEGTCNKRVDAECPAGAAATLRRVQRHWRQTGRGGVQDGAGGRGQLEEQAEGRQME